MTKSVYEPQPVDLSQITLDDKMEELCEMLSENTHNTWAQSRIQEGWSFGPEVNNQKKETPLLSPYEDLPEEIKENNRDTVRTSLKLIKALGYEFSPNGMQDQQQSGQVFKSIQVEPGVVPNIDLDRAFPVLDTSSVEMTSEMSALQDKIAEAVHDEWSKNKMDQGWTYGPVRDSVAKTHECLIPYSELTEVEKAYDKNLAMETIKACQLSGFDLYPQNELSASKSDSLHLALFDGDEFNEGQDFDQWMKQKTEQLKKTIEPDAADDQDLGLDNDIQLNF